MNLFGIKAGSSWKGDDVVRKTIEFDGSVARTEHARFRAYSDVASAFSDYLKFLGDNPRYADVKNHGTDAPGFARALQESGYATDPEYADKIIRIMESPTMRRVLTQLEAGDGNV